MHTASVREIPLVDPATDGVSDWALAQTQMLADALEQRVIEHTSDLQSRYEREHRLVEMLRHALLLTPPPTSFPGLAVEALAEIGVPEALIGGDFCDAFPLDAENTALILGDVCGKGLVAALHVPEIKFALRAFLNVDASPANALARLNDWLCSAHRGTGPFSLAALSLVVLNGRNGRGNCCLAGAEAPLILRAGGGVETIAASGITLGIEAGRSYEAFPFRMHEGDLLLMTTDGITEARWDGAFLGIDGLAALAAQAWTRQTEGQPEIRAVGAAVLDGARRFADGFLQDDACLLLAQRVRT